MQFFGFLSIAINETIHSQVLCTACFICTLHSLLNCTEKISEVYKYLWWFHCWQSIMYFKSLPSPSFFPKLDDSRQPFLSCFQWWNLLRACRADLLSVCLLLLENPKLTFSMGIFLITATLPQMVTTLGYSATALQLARMLLLKLPSLICLMSCVSLGLLCLLFTATPFF